MSCKLEERLLLAVVKGKTLQSSEDDGVVCDDDAVLALYSFLGDSFCEVDGEQDRVLVAVGREEGSFEQEACVVEGLVGQTFGVEGAHRLYHRASEWRGGHGERNGSAERPRWSCYCHCHWCNWRRWGCSRGACEERADRREHQVQLCCRVMVNVEAQLRLGEYRQ